MRVLKITDKPLSESDYQIGVEPVMPVYPQDIPVSEYYRHMAGYLERRFEVLTPGEVGIALAHRRAWEVVSSSDEPAIILESDITITVDQFRHVESLLLGQEVDFIQLGWHPTMFSEACIYDRNLFRSGDPVIRQAFWFRRFTGAFSYYLSCSGAKILLESSADYLKRSDDWVLHFKKTRTPAYFCGVFLHPIERGVTWRERLSCPVLSLKRFVAIRLKQRFDFYRERIVKLIARPIHPDDETRERYHGQ